MMRTATRHTASDAVLPGGLDGGFGLSRRSYEDPPLVALDFDACCPAGCLAARQVLMRPEMVVVEPESVIEECMRSAAASSQA